MNLPNSDTRSEGRTPGLLLVGHGTRHPGGTAELLATAEMVAERQPGVAVEPCFLELASPTIDQGIASLASAGVSEVTVVPLLLFAAAHAKRDIPAAVSTAAAQHSRLKIRSAPPLGCREPILELSARRFRESVAVAGNLPPRETALLMVGRGSHDESVSAEMHRFARLRSLRTPVALAQTCFLAMAKPSVDEALLPLAARKFRRVVVQPHLLFDGELLARLHARLEEARRQWPTSEWIVTKHLGPHDLLVDAILEMATEAGAALAVGR